MHRRFLIPALFSAAFVTLAAPAFAQGALSVSDPWARATAANARAGAAYLTINAGNEADKLIAASTPVSEKAEIHATYSEGGMMKMKPVGAIAVDAGKSVSLAPGGYHVMLVGLKHPLTAGESFPLTLTFAKGGTKTVMVMVRPVGAAASSMNMGAMGDHAHGDMKH